MLRDDVLPSGPSSDIDSERQGDGDQRVTPAEEIEYLKGRVAELEKIIAGDLLFPRSWGLTRTEQMVLGMLYKRDQVTRTQMMTYLYSDRGNPPEEQILAVYASRLRSVLAPFGIQIKAIWGVGYAMPKESKDKLKGVVRDAMA